MIPAISRRFGAALPSPSQGTWGVHWPLLAFAAYLALGAMLVLLFPGQDSESRFFSRLVLSQVSAVLTMALMLFVASRNGGVTALGLGGFRSGDFAWAGLSYLCMIPVFFGGAILWKAALKMAGIPIAPQEMLLRLPELPRGELFFALAVIVLFGPFFEELFFRAFLQQSLERRFGQKAGWILAAFLFAAVHEWVAKFPIFLLGLYFGYLYRRSGRIWVPWMAHALHNALMAGLWLALPDARDSLGG